MPVIRGLFVYPVKSCGAIALDRARLDAHGLPWDRHWMAVDATGRFVSQREYPAMARIVPAFVESGVRLAMDGMATALTLPFEPRAPLARVAVTVWKDGFEALDEGDEAARWFSSALGVPLRLVRFAPDVTRLASRKWTGGDAPVQFADGFPLLVTSEASLAELNARLVAKGAPALPMDRFRPNIVVDGGEAFDEDFIETMAVGGADAIVLRFVKPCARCPITTVDQRKGAHDPRWPNEPLDTMAGYRANARVDGGLTFGQNAMVVEGAGRQLSVGAEAGWEFRFEG